MCGMSAYHLWLTFFALKIWHYTQYTVPMPGPVTIPVHIELLICQFGFKTFTSTCTTSRTIIAIVVILYNLYKCHTDMLNTAYYIAE